MTVLMKGKEVVDSLTAKMSIEIKALKDKGITPGLAIIRLGANPDDISYERNVLKKSENLGVNCQVYNFAENITYDDFSIELTKINNNNAIHGILIFRPLPKQIDENSLKTILNPGKDIDCLTSVNVAKVFEGDESGHFPCTAESVIEILDHYGINLEGKNTVIVGRSMVVGKPLAMMMLKRNATVTVCHSKTRNLKELCKKAEIVVAAIGKARFVTADFVSEGSIVVDVGINVDAGGNLCGDVDFDNIQKIAAYITPVPGGVGTVTSSVLIKHLIKSAKHNRAAWLIDKRREAEERYDTLWAPLYGEKWGTYPNETHQQFIQKFLSLLPKHSAILDAACGAGRYMSMLLEKGHTVVGIDQSQGMLSRAIAKFPTVKIEKISLQELSYYEAFDGIICMDAMEHIFPEDWPPVLNNFHKALKLHGYLYFTVEIADDKEIEEAFNRAQQLGCPVFYGECADGEVYHYYPLVEQVKEWIRETGFDLMEQGEGDGYRHFVIRKA